VLRACSVRCRYLVVTSKGWYGYGLSRSGRATWHVATVHSSRLLAPVTNWEPHGVTLAGYCYGMRHGMKVQIVTAYGVGHLQHYGIKEHGNLTSVYPHCNRILLTDTERRSVREWESYSGHYPMSSASCNMSHTNRPLRWPLQNMICGCREVQKTVEVAESFQALLSNHPVAQSSVSVQLINISDSSQLFDCISNIIPFKVKFITYKSMYSNNCIPGNNHVIFPGIRLVDYWTSIWSSTTIYSKTCLKRNAILPVFFFPFSQVSVLQRVVF
jgi:hypothetical protein